ncbi:MAG: hypothetical protein C4303_02275 [candidate division GAL15 bacterium]
MLMASPVFALVVAVLVYSVVSCRSQGDPPEPPPYLPEHPAVPRVWFAATAALAAYVIYNPGLVGLAEMREVPLRALLASSPASRVRLASLADPDADLVVRVRASRWLWQFDYPQQGLTTRELVLPVGRRVRFEVTSVDIVHSFWVPAFRTKIDAVPNLTTVLHVTPTRTGSFQDTVALRVQCAELCGVGHGIMAAPGRVLDPEGFEAWVAAEQARR